jgi:carboxyl-terminal processing protease
MRYTKIFILVGALLVSCQLHSDNRKQEYSQSRDALLRAHYLLFHNYADAIDSQALAKAAIDGMTKALDPYTVYLEKQEKFQLDMLTKGEYGGVGIRIGMRGDTLTVISPMEDTPAWRAGFLPGDRIIRIDTMETKKLNIETASDMIRGKAGSEVVLTVERENVPGELVFTLVREKIEVQEVPYADFIEPGIAYIKLNGFSKNASNQIRERLIELQKAGIEGLILDLRNNTGGLLDQALEVLNLYLPGDIIAVETRGLNPRFSRKFKLSSKPILDENVRIAILINQGSASASEIVAGVTQDLDRGIVLGRRSFGKGLVQNIFPLSDTSAVKITTSKYYIPSGRLIQKENYIKDNTILKEFESGADAFFTRGGRKVEAGGGIYPDTLIIDEPVGELVSALWRRQYFSRFAREFLLEHPEFTGKENTEYFFFQPFAQWLQKRDFSLQQPPLKEIEKLEKAFIDAKKNSDAIQSAFAALKEAATLPIDSLLTAEKDILLLFLESELRGFHGGQKARIEGRMDSDITLKTALKLIQDNAYLQEMGISPFNRVSIR